MSGGPEQDFWHNLHRYCQNVYIGDAAPMIWFAAMVIPFVVIGVVYLKKNNRSFWL